MSENRLALIPGNGVIPLQVIEGAVTLPNYFAIDPSNREDFRTVVVAVGTARGVSGQHSGLLLVRPTLELAGEIPAGPPFVLADRWSAHDVVSSFAIAFPEASGRAQFIHVRITVPVSGAQLDNDLLEAVLLLDRLGICELGPIVSVVSGHHQLSISSRPPSRAGVERVLNVSIVLSDCELANARVDFHGDGSIWTLKVSGHAAGSAAGAAYRYDEEGQFVLPALYSDPVRSSLLRLNSVVNGHAANEDITRFNRALSEANRVRAAGAAILAG